MTRPSQVDRVLYMLKAAQPLGLCGLSLYVGDDYGPLPNGRNRVSELSGAGHHIETTSAATHCATHRSHGGVTYRVYFYLHGPGPHRSYCRDPLLQGRLAMEVP